MIDPISSSISPMGMPQFNSQREKFRDILQSKVLDKLSAATGLSTEELQASFEDSIRTHFQVLRDAGISREDMRQFRQEALGEAVEEGLISQDDADAINRRSRMGMGQPPGPPPGAGEGNIASAMKSVLEQLIEKLGIEDEDELLSLIPANTSLRQFAQDNSVDLLDSDSIFDILI